MIKAKIASMDSELAQAPWTVVIKAKEDFRNYTDHGLLDIIKEQADFKRASLARTEVLRRMYEGRD